MISSRHACLLTAGIVILFSVSARREERLPLRTKQNKAQLQCQ